jgi:hypothetical protein
MRNAHGLSPPLVSSPDGRLRRRPPAHDRLRQRYTPPGTTATRATTTYSPGYTATYSSGYTATAAPRSGYWNSATRDADRDGIPNRYDRDANGDRIPDRYQGRPAPRY